MWNSELCRSIYAELDGKVTMENVVDGLGFLSVTRSDISTEFEFLALYFDDFFCRGDTLNVLTFFNNGPWISEPQQRGQPL
jgi:hypothetical protein